MDSVLLQSPMEERSPDLGLFPETNYESMLRESVKRFLTGIDREGFDFSGFRSVMSRQLQSKAEPPLEIVWLYSAASYHESIAAKDSFDRVRAVRDLVQLLSAFSAASGGAKCIALIAPAVYDLYQCVVEDGLVEKKAMKEFECLLEGILSYISICSGQHSDSEEISTGLHACFLDLVKVWTSRRSSSGGSLDAFFPLVSNEVRKRFEMEGCGVDYLAGVVTAEAFLLRLCLKVKGGGPSRKEMQKELGIWAVSSITAFSNSLFFEILLKFLLDPKAIATTLLNTEDEKLVRGVLYDAVILVDYSLIFPGKEMGQYDKIRNLLVTKLIVTNEAVKIACSKGDHGKAISYLNAFSTSSLPRELIKCVCKQIGNSSSEKPTDNSPEGLLNWLVHLEQRGQRIFDDEASIYATKLILDDKSTPLAVESASPDAKKMDADLFFFDRGDSEMESMDDALFSATAQSMKQFSSIGRVKRKESRGEEAGKRFKFVKYEFQNKPVQDPDHLPYIAADGTSSDGRPEEKMNARWQVNPLDFALRICVAFEVSSSWLCTSCMGARSCATNFGCFT